MRLIIALLMVFVATLTPSVASADHNWYGCPSGWDGEVAGYTTGQTWVSFQVEVNGEMQDQWFYFDEQVWPGYAFAARLGVSSGQRIDGVHVFTAGSVWHIANKTCHAP